ncbi:hypothetical protein ACWCQW_06585 [Streptomyces mirabilis]
MPPKSAMKKYAPSVLATRTQRNFWRTSTLPVSVEASGRVFV